MSAFLSSCLRHASRRSVWIGPLARTCSTSVAPLAVEPQQLPVYASCVLARAPVIKPQLEDWEVEYHEWAEKFRARKERPAPSDWQKARKTTVAAEEESTDQAVETTSQWTEVPRVTEADRTGDVKSLMRRLDRYLYFIVKARSGAWSFPKAANLDGETIRQTGERALAEGVMAGVDVFFIANWPIAHYAFREDAVPRTEYYMKAQLLSGDVTLLDGGPWMDYAWIDKSEMSEYFSQEPKLAQLLTRALV